MATHTHVRLRFSGIGTSQVTAIIEINTQEEREADMRVPEKHGVFCPPSHSSLAVQEESAKPANQQEVHEKNREGRGSATFWKSHLGAVLLARIAELSLFDLLAHLFE